MKSTLEKLLGELRKKGIQIVLQNGSLEIKSSKAIVHTDWPLINKTKTAIMAYLTCPANKRFRIEKRQKRLWNLERRNFGLPRFNQALPFQIEEHIDASFLKDSLGKLVQAFPQLRLCLLYTSPSPRDLSTSRMPSSA